MLAAFATVCQCGQHTVCEQITQRSDYCAITGDAVNSWMAFLLLNATLSHVQKLPYARDAIHDDIMSVLLAAVVLHDHSRSLPAVSQYS